MRHLLKNSHLRDNVAFIMIAIAAYLAVPAIVHAEITKDDITVFSQPLALSRGSLTPEGEETYLLNQDKICPLVTEQFGWEKSECRQIEAISFFYLDQIDTLMVMKPSDEGYIKTDDWLGSDKDQAIKDMQAELEAIMHEQSKWVGVPIEFVR